MNKTSTTGKSPDGEPSDLSAPAEALRDITAAFNSTLHFDEVLDRILTNVGHVVPHDSADIMLLESGIARVVRSRGYVERGLETSVLAVRLTVEDVPTLRQMAETGQPIDRRKRERVSAPRFPVCSGTCVALIRLAQRRATQAHGFR